MPLPAARTVFALLLAASASVSAEDGLALHFTIKKTEGAQVDTYTNGILMRLTESTTARFPGQYELDIAARTLDPKRVNLVVTLKDLTGDKPRYAGSGQTTIEVGQAVSVPMHSLANGPRYEVSINSAYGELPGVAKK